MSAVLLWFDPRSHAVATYGRTSVDAPLRHQIPSQTKGSTTEEGPYRSLTMTDYQYPADSNLDPNSQAALHSEHTRLVLELQDGLAKLNEQARIFVPLIALGLIVAMPIWSKSLVRFLELVLSPFVLLPLGFCIIHLALACRRIVRARSRIRDWERTAERTMGLK